MPYTDEDRARVLARVRRIKGQLDAIERALEADADCAAVLQQIAAVRGATHGLMATVMQAHVRGTFGQPTLTDADRAVRVDELTTLIHTYLK